jgi:penicillin G amidase
VLSEEVLVSKTVKQDSWSAALPDMTGVVTVDGIQGSVEIHRDRHGIPHIRASTLSDAFFGQGFAHAQDRLWQMEWDRRRAYGRTAELTGKEGLTNDVFARRATLGDSARTDYEHFNAETKAMMDSYAAGVNAFINTTAVLPVEFTLSGITPEPWQPWDGCAIYKIRHILMGTGMGKLWKARLMLAFGPEITSRLRSQGIDDEVLVVPPGGEHIAAIHEMADFEPGVQALSQLFDMDAGSNNWAVHGTRTASGKPLMAGDPHRALDVPNVYYQNHVSCPEFDVVGMSFTGVPGFPHFGHNDSVAWCITHAAADYQDLYVEKFDPQNPGRYEYRGEMHDATQRTETIQVKDGDPVEVDITVTRNGPVVIGDPATGHAISMRYTATAEPNECFHALLPMLKTTTVDEFDEAMRPWVDPCNNLIVIDTEGAIGYLTRGKVPVRNRSNAWLPVPGWTGDHDWQGVIPFEEMPRLRDPEIGYIVTANNRIVGKDYAHYLALDYAPPGRAQRILARLSELEKATVADMSSVHADRKSLPARFFVDLVTSIETDDQMERATIEKLTNWDHQMDTDSVGAAIYIAIRDAILRAVMDQPAVAPLKATPFSGEPAGVSLGGVLWWMVPGLIKDNDTSMLAEDTTWQDIIRTALSQAVTRLNEMLGPDIDSWQWGNIHRTAPIHPLTSTYPEHQADLNPPSVSIGGDGDTPQAAAIVPGASFNVAGTSVARYIFDASDWNNCRWIVPLGASGHPGSEHWADQAQKWSVVDTIPMLYDWDQITAEAESSQTLKPS